MTSNNDGEGEGGNEDHLRYGYKDRRPTVDIGANCHMCLYVYISDRSEELSNVDKIMEKLVESGH